MEDKRIDYDEIYYLALDGKIMGWRSYKEEEPKLNDKIAVWQPEFGNVFTGIAKESVEREGVLIKFWRIRDIHSPEIAGEAYSEDFWMPYDEFEKGIQKIK